MSERLDILKDWAAHPGTQLFFDHIDREWGAGGTRFDSIWTRFADSREEDRIVLEQIRQIAVCRREILRLKTWADEEIHRLDQKPASNNPRPALEPALAGQSRRGGL